MLATILVPLTVCFSSAVPCQTRGNRDIAPFLSLTRVALTAVITHQHKSASFASFTTSAVEDLCRDSTLVFSISLALLTSNQGKPFKPSLFLVHVYNSLLLAREPLPKVMIRSSRFFFDYASEMLSASLSIKSLFLTALVFSPVIAGEPKFSRRNGVKYEVIKDHVTGSSIEFVKNSGICETTPGVNTYSGYLNVGTNASMFFWFFEARHNPSQAPLAL